MKSNPPAVSVIIPCYNAEKWITEAVESALGQSHGNIEVVVVDDGSSDRSVDRLRAFGSRIVLETGPNRGGCAARNQGVELSQGDWIQFLDADDLLTPDCVADKLAFKTKENERVCSGLKSIENDVPFSPPEWWSRKRWPLEFMLSKGTPQTSLPLHRRDEFLAVGGFREHLPCAQEFDLHLRLAIHHGIEFVSNNEVGVLIRPTEGSVSRKAGNVKMPLYFASILADAWELLKKQNPPELKKYADILAGTLGRVARKLHRRGANKEATHYAKLAKEISPNWLNGAYDTSTATRTLARLLGFECTERLIACIRAPSSPS